MDESPEPLTLRIPDLRERFELARAGQTSPLCSRATAELLRPRSVRGGRTPSLANGDDRGVVTSDDHPSVGS